MGISHRKTIIMAKTSDQIIQEAAAEVKSWPAWKREIVRETLGNLYPGMDKKALNRLTGIREPEYKNFILVCGKCKSQDVTAEKHYNVDLDIHSVELYCRHCKNTETNEASHGG
jgi:hypothetical protein